MMPSPTRLDDSSEIRVMGRMGTDQRGRGELRAYYDQQIAALERAKAPAPTKTPRLDAAERYLAVIEEYDATMKRPSTAPG
jgi:hypothetical protein